MKIPILKYLKYLLVFALAALLAIIALNFFIPQSQKKFLFSKTDQIPDCYTAIVLGALVNKDGDPSDFLQDRLDVAIELYHTKKVKRLLLSGDHGTVNYDEVNHMKQYLLEHDVPLVDIFLDHAGFDTYNTMARAKKIFGIGEAIIVTQEFHLPRAVYIARKMGINAYGIRADRREYQAISRLRFREKIAIVKAFVEVSIKRKPKFLGSRIPITGDSKLSYD